MSSSSESETVVKKKDSPKDVPAGAPAPAPVRIVTTRSPPELSNYKATDVALAAVISCKQQEQISDFVTFIVRCLERNNSFVNSYVSRQTNFKCVFMVGDGPNRYKIKDVIYPGEPDEDFTLDLEILGSEDHDKIAFAALLKLTTEQIAKITDYTKNHLIDSSKLNQDLYSGKMMGAMFAVLKPISQKHYRMMERISIGELSKAKTPAKNQKRMDRVKSPILKSIKRLKFL